MKPIARRRFLAATAVSGAFTMLNAASPQQERGVSEQWDVFTSTPLTGNPLAVFLDARGLSDATMQAIARETNLSETTFIFPRDAAIERERGVRVRIFTREQELDFAGHPVLGTAMAIRARLGSPRIVKLDLNAGIIPVDFETTPRGIYGEMLQPEPVPDNTIYTPAAIAPLLGLTESDFDARYPIRNWSTGRPNLIVMLRSLDAVAKASVDWPAAARFFATGDKQRGFYLLTRQTANTAARVHARKPTRAGDDPVTGSAAGAAAAYLVEQGLAKPGERVVIEQGSEVHRPGDLTVSALRDEATRRIHTVRVGGYAVKIWEAKARW